jgi:Ca2+-binding RTX toxin-like protein
MAVVNIYTPNRYAGFTTGLAQYYGAQTATNFEVINSYGTLMEVNVGHNFTYGGNGFFNGGTINASYLFGGDGSLAYGVTGLELSVVVRNNSLTVGTDSSEYYRTVLSGDDTITGSYGADKIFGSKGNDTINGGDGVDVLTFLGFGGGVTVDLSAGTAQTAFGTSALKSIEDLEGSTFADTLKGNSSGNFFQGFGGNDAIDGAGGLDTASYLDATSAVTVNLATGTATGGSGSDTLLSIERVIGSRFGDSLTGSSRADIFVGGLGDDSIDGGGGADTIEFINLGAGVVVDLTAGTTSGGAGNDTLLDIENIAGSIFDDSLRGSNKVNVLHGGNGNDIVAGLGGGDRLFGDDGNDSLRGGAGNDVMDGGAGRDAFRFDTALGAANADTIVGFVAADDTIQLENTIFSVFGTTVGAIAAANFRAIVNGGATDANDYIVYNKTTGAVLYDANGSVNGLTDAVQFATLDAHPTVTSADFVLI